MAPPKVCCKATVGVTPGVPHSHPCRCTMCSDPGAISTEKIRPGSFAARTSIPGPPVGSYRVRKIPVPLATRFRPAIRPPPPPPVFVVWLSCMFADIQARSPWVEMTASPGSSNSSSTGSVDPFTSAFIEKPPCRLVGLRNRSGRRPQSALCGGRRREAATVGLHADFGMRASPS